MELWIDGIQDHEELPLGGEYKGNKVNQYPEPPVEHLDQSTVIHKPRVKRASDRRIKQ